MLAYTTLAISYSGGLHGYLIGLAIIYLGAKKMEKVEIERQLFHATVGVAIVALIYLDMLKWWGLLAILAADSVLILLSRKYRVPGIYWFLKRFERPEVMKIFPTKGAFFFILGAFIVILLFGKLIGMASIMICVLGDSLSHLVGKCVGRVKHPFSNTKFIEGHIAGAIIGALGAMLFVPPLTALIAASIAMFIEGIDIGFGMSWVLDDNLVVPLTAGVVIFLIGA